MEYYLGFFAGIIAALAICLAIIKYKEVKAEKNVKNTDELPVRFTVADCKPTPIQVEMVIPRCEMQGLPIEYVEEKISRQLAKEIMKYADLATEENMMSLTTKVKARVWVVKGWGEFR